MAKENVFDKVEIEGEKKNKTVDVRDLNEQLGPLYQKVEEDKKKHGDKFYYRLTNVRKLQMREFQGYELVEGQSKDYGGLVVMRLPKELREAREKMKEDKIRARTRSLRETFHQEGRERGVGTFDFEK